MQQHQSIQQHGERRQRPTHYGSPHRIDVPKDLYVNLLRFLENKYDQRVVRKWNSFYGESDFLKVAFLESPEAVVLFLKDAHSGRVNQISVKIADIEVQSPPPRIDVPREHYPTVYRYIRHLAGAIYRRANKFYSERDGSPVAEILSREMLGVVVEEGQCLFGKTMMQEINIPMLVKAYRVFHSYDAIGQTDLLSEEEINYLLGSWANDMSRKPRRVGISSRKQHISILPTLPIFSAKNTVRKEALRGYSVIEVAEIRINREILTMAERLEAMKRLGFGAQPAEEVIAENRRVRVQAQAQQQQIVHIPFAGLSSMRNIKKIRDRILSAENAERTPPPTSWLPSFESGEEHAQHDLRGQR